MLKLLFFSLMIPLASAQTDGPEEILGYQPIRHGITFQVKSGGCTRQDDFRVHVERTSSVAEVTLIRVVPDTCQSLLPVGVHLNYRYEEMGLKPGERFTVKNSNGVGYGFIW